jgi:hypothetical protein
MQYDQEKVDAMILALLYLTSSTDQFGTRAWKGLNSEVLDRLYRQGYISDPQSKSPTLLLSPEGAARSQKLFWETFGLPEGKNEHPS